MNVVSSLSIKEVTCEAQKILQKSATVITDGRRCYNNLKEICTKHESIIIKDKTQVASVFPWVHTAISNAKRYWRLASSNIGVMSSPGEGGHLRPVAKRWTIGQSSLGTTGS